MTVENISIDVKTNAGSAASQFRSLSSALGGVRSAGKGIASGGAHKSISRIGSAAKSATKHTSKLLSSLKRIAMYRLLRTFIKELSQAFQEGLKNAYAFSKAIGGSLAQALDGLKSATGQMKNQMGAAFGELLQTIMPIINAIVSAITSLMRALSALFAALGGRLTYTVAEKTAESWDDAAGSAKEYKNTVLGFDELNKLNDETGGGGGGADGQGAFGELELPDWAKKIQEAIELGDWYGAGKALADHLNDLIDAWDAYAAGVRLGEKINQVIDFAYGFLKNFHFEKFGKKIADFINGAIKTIKWNTLGRTLVRGITGMLDFVIGFIKQIDTGAIATAISDFLLGVFDEATEWLGEHDWKTLGEIVSQKIHYFLTNVKWGEIASSASTFLSEAINAIANFLDGVDWEKLTNDAFDAFDEFVENIDWDKLGQSAWHLFSSAFTAAGKVLRIVLTRIGIDTEGTITAEEITDFLEKAVLPVGGAILGWKTAGLGGAALGLTVGAVLSFEFQKYIEEADGEIDYQDLMDKIIKVALPIAGAVLGWKLGGIGGAAIGVTLGIAISLLFNDFVSADGGFTWETFWNAIFNSGVLPIAGAILGWKLTHSVAGAVVGLTLGSVISLTVKDLAGIDGALDTTAILTAICKNVIPAVFGAVVGGAVGGLPGALIGMTIGVALSFVVQSTSWSGGWDMVGQAQQKMNAELYGVRMNANGGSMENDGTLFVAGEAGPEIVANMGSRTGVMNVDQMEAAVANGNIGVINAVYQMANMIVKAVNEIDPDITLDGESMANAMYKYNKQAANRHGMAMVT